MLVLGIETSCDETAVSVVQGKNQKLKVLSNTVSSQVDIHRQYGGVVPEVAARQHTEHILPVLDQALKQAGLTRHQDKAGLDAIAVVNGPGLVTSLMVGVETAKSLALAWGLPVVGVNHIEAHIYANFITQAEIAFPAVVLTVSGGHTKLVLMHGHGQYQALGETRDDAAGEAFDKAAQLLDLGYPGGPVMAQQAAQARQKGSLSLPRPMLASDDYDFSFSGLKTALLYALRKDPAWQDRVPEYCAEFQAAVNEVLVAKAVRAAQACHARSLLLAGGVAANQDLRQRMRQASVNVRGLELYVPELAYTTDNAAMVAAAGYFRAQRSEFTAWQSIKVDPNLDF